MILEISAWLLLLLGVGHTALGIFRFRVPFGEIMAEGFFDRFKVAQRRALAFWFTLFGPMLILIGNISLHAVHTNNTTLLKIIGFYVLAIGTVGAIALPKSPFWLAMAIAVVFLVGGFGYISP